MIDDGLEPGGIPPGDVADVLSIHYRASDSQAVVSNTGSQTDSSSTTHSQGALSNLSFVDNDTTPSDQPAASTTIDISDSVMGMSSTNQTILARLAIPYESSDSPRLPTGLSSVTAISDSNWIDITIHAIPTNGLPLLPLTGVGIFSIFINGAIRRINNVVRRTGYLSTYDTQAFRITVDGQIYRHDQIVIFYQPDPTSANAIHDQLSHELDAFNELSATIINQTYDGMIENQAANLPKSAHFISPQERSLTSSVQKIVRTHGAANIVLDRTPPDIIACIEPTADIVKVHLFEILNGDQNIVSRYTVTDYRNDFVDVIDLPSTAEADTFIELIDTTREHLVGYVNNEGSVDGVKFCITSLANMQVVCEALIDGYWQRLFSIPCSQTTSSILKVPFQGAKHVDAVRLRVAGKLSTSLSDVKVKVNALDAKSGVRHIRLSHFSDMRDAPGITGSDSEGWIPSSGDTDIVTASLGFNANTWLLHNRLSGGIKSVGTHQALPNYILTSNNTLYKSFANLLTPSLIKDFDSDDIIALGDIDALILKNNVANRYTGSTNIPYSFAPTLGVATAAIKFKNAFWVGTNAGYILRLGNQGFSTISRQVGKTVNKLLGGSNLIGHFSLTNRDTIEYLNGDTWKIITSNNLDQLTILASNGQWLLYHDVSTGYNLVNAKDNWSVKTIILPFELADITAIDIMPLSGSIIISSINQMFWVDKDTQEVHAIIQPVESHDYLEMTVVRSNIFDYTNTHSTGSATGTAHVDTLIIDDLDDILTGSYRYAIAEGYLIPTLNGEYSIRISGGAYQRLIINGIVDESWDGTTSAYTTVIKAIAGYPISIRIETAHNLNSVNSLKLEWIKPNRKVFEPLEVGYCVSGATQSITPTYIQCTDSKTFVGGENGKVYSINNDTLLYLGNVIWAQARDFAGNITATSKLGRDAILRGIAHSSGIEVSPELIDITDDAENARLSPGGSGPLFSGKRKISSVGRYASEPLYVPTLTRWDTAAFFATLQPGTLIRIRARSADSLDTLENTSYTDWYSRSAISPADDVGDQNTALVNQLNISVLTGKFIQFEVELESRAINVTPALHSVTLTCVAAGRTFVFTDVISSGNVFFRRGLVAANILENGGQIHFAILTNETENNRFDFNAYTIIEPNKIFTLNSASTVRIAALLISEDENNPSIINDFAIQLDPGTANPVI